MLGSNRKRRKLRRWLHSRLLLGPIRPSRTLRQRLHFRARLQSQRLANLAALWREDHFTAETRIRVRCCCNSKALVKCALGCWCGGAGANEIVAVVRQDLLVGSATLQPGGPSDNYSLFVEAVSLCAVGNFNKMHHTNWNKHSLKHSFFGEMVKKMFPLVRRKHGGSRRCCSSSLISSEGQALCLSIFNLSPTQKTCLFTHGNKANVYEAPGI